MALRKYKKLTYRKSPHDPGEVFHQRYDRPTETVKLCAQGDATEVGDGTVRDFDYGFVIPANTLDGHVGRGIGPPPLPATDGRDVATDVFLPPEFPVYGLDLATARDTLITQRGPGDFYYWSADGTFRKESDSTKPIVMGRQVGPTKRIGGYTFRPHYPQWVLNKSMVTGQRVWLSHHDGWTRVVEAKRNLNLPQEYLFSTDDFDFVDDYEPWLGVFTSPRVPHVVPFPMDFDSAEWLTDSGVTKTPIGDGIIEGKTAYRITSTTVGNRMRDTGYDFNIGEIWSFAIIVRPTAGRVSRVNVNNSSAYININDGGVNGNVLFNGTNARGLRRFLGNGWVYYWMRWECTTNGTNRSLSCIAEQDGLGTNSIDVAYLGLAQCDYPFMPVDGAVTTPLWDAYQCGTIDALWRNQGMDTEGSVLSGLTYHSDPTANTGVSYGAVTASQLYNSVDTVIGARDHVTYRFGAGASSNSSYPSGSEGVRVHSAAYSFNDEAVTLHQSIPGEATRSNVISAFTGQYSDPAKNEMRIGQAALTTAPLVPVWLRYAAWWNERGLYDFETEFGPAAFGG